MGNTWAPVSDEADPCQALAVAVIQQALVDAAWTPREAWIGRMSGEQGEQDRN